MKSSVRKACGVFAIYIMDGKEKNNQLNVEDIPNIKDSKDIFLEEIPELPPKSDIDLQLLCYQG